MKFICFAVLFASFTLNTVNGQRVLYIASSKQLKQFEALSAANEIVACPSCVPKTRWKEDCNVCVCSVSGLPFCTRKSCQVTRAPETSTYKSVPKTTTDQSLTEKVYTEQEAYDPNFKCRAFTQLKVQCNICFCSRYGTLGPCSMINCLPGKKSVADVLSSGKFCNISSHFG